MRSYLILLMCVLFLMQYFFEILLLGYLVVIMALMAFIASATKSRGFPRVIAIFMMGLGITLEFHKGTGIEGITQGILLILPLLCLITLAPLLAIPLKLEGYFEAVESLLQKLLHHPKRLFAGITTTLFILSPILNLGSVRIINEFLSDLKLPPVMSAKSYLIGFTTAILWSPYFASVSLVLYYLEIPFGKYILYGIGLSFLSLLVGNCLFAIWEHQHPLNRNENPEIPIESRHLKQLIHLALFVVILISTSLTIEYITKWSMIIIVCLISTSLPLIWGIAKNGWNKLYPQWKSYRDVTVPMMNNEIMLFTSAGLLGHAIQGTSFAVYISHFLTTIANKSFLLFAIAVMVIVLLVTYVGIHQIAVVTTLAMQLDAQELGISSLALAMLLLLAWSMSTALSPFSGLNLMVSRFVGSSGYEVGFRANGLYLSIVSIIGIFIIMIIG